MGKLIKLSNVTKRAVESDPEAKPVDGSRLRQLAKSQASASIVTTPRRNSSSLINSSSKRSAEIIPGATDGTKLKYAIEASRSDRVKVVVPSRDQLMLGTRKCERDNSGQRCTECSTLSKMVYGYRESNKGAVRLCETCNAYALERSFGQDDAMEHTGLPSGKAAANRPQIRISKRK
jgi:hypothetical protein